MDIDIKFKTKINNCVVRIIAEDISINWKLPYLYEQPNKGQGTGFFIDIDGHILTCAHVVNSAKNVYIEIPSLTSEKIHCKIIGICPDFDIALLKTIDYKPKEFLKLGNSEKLNVGNKVQVVGYPVSSTLSSRNVNNIKYTEGIIKGQGSDLIETDSAINPGNSGGPMFCNKEVIGINSKKLTGKSLENIGYAVPINYYKVIKDDFIHKIIYRPSLLFDFNNTNEKILKELTNGKVNKGIIISKLFKGSLLKKAGLNSNSIITEINNYKIDNYGLINYKWLDANLTINNLLNRFKNTEEIEIKYFDIKTEKFEKVKIKLEPLKFPSRHMYNIFEKIDYIIFGGMVFMNLCYNNSFNQGEPIMKLLNITLNNEKKLQKHLVVSFIFPNSTVNILNNITENCIIKKVNEINVNSLSSLRKALKFPIIINKKKYIKIESDNGRSVILLLKDIIDEDIELSKTYNFPLNKFHKNI